MWQQFNFYCSESLLRLHPNSEFYDRFYGFKRELLPILDEHNAEDFLILDEDRFFLLRVELYPEAADALRGDVDRLVDESSDFDKVTVESWSLKKMLEQGYLGRGEELFEGVFLLRISLKEVGELKPAIEISG
jgi:hypothetical protein